MPDRQKRERKPVDRGTPIAEILGESQPRRSRLRMIGEAGAAIWGICLLGLIAAAVAGVDVSSAPEWLVWLMAPLFLAGSALVLSDWIRSRIEQARLAAAPPPGERPRSYIPVSVPRGDAAGRRRMPGVRKRGRHAVRSHNPFLLGRLLQSRELAAPMWRLQPAQGRDPWLRSARSKRDTSVSDYLGVRRSWERGGRRS